MEQMQESLLTIKELKNAVHGKIVGLAENIKNFSFTSVAIDSRQVVPGALFVPLIGEFQDGHKYIPQAIEKGASVIFVTKSIYEEDARKYMSLASENPKVTFVVVNNNLHALQDAARVYVTKFPHLVKIAITGSSGKTTMGAIYIMAKTILVPGFKTYILCNSGQQSVEMFTKLEQIATKAIPSFKSLTDVFVNELVKSQANTNGFVHNPASYTCRTYNNSQVFTLNGCFDNNRGKRASLVFFDEAAFCSDDIFISGEPFVTQNSSFFLSKDMDVEDMKTQPKQFPNQLILKSTGFVIFVSGSVLLFSIVSKLSLSFFRASERRFVTVPVGMLKAEDISLTL